MEQQSTIPAAGICAVFCWTLLGSCSSSSADREPRSHMIEIRAMQFQPSELIVNKGDTVIFLNKDMLVHDVTEEKEKAWSSSPLEPNMSFHKVITESAAYFCSFHPSMKGTITTSDTDP